ncbi:MAG: hypothetical protein ACK6DW_16270 [Betaproteobacteria bacterium]|jgi:hypothetical protein
MSAAVMSTLAPAAGPADWFCRLSPARLAADSPRYAALGLFLALATIPMCGALALDTRLFNGLNVWIKPLKFHVSLSVYLLTLAWFTRYASPDLRSRRWWRWHERAVVCAVLAEVLWIGGAAAIGVGSHFNESTRLLQVLYALMGVGAVVLTTASTTLAWAIHRRDDTGLSPAMKAAVVWGLALTLPLTLVTAGTMSQMGGHWVGGARHDVAGLALMGWARDGGDLRVAHFFATHAMHALPLIALASARLSGGRSLMPVRASALLYTGLVVFPFAQALMGRPFLPGLGA